MRLGVDENGGRSASALRLLRRDRLLLRPPMSAGALAKVDRYPFSSYFIVVRNGVHILCAKRSETTTSYGYK